MAVMPYITVLEALKDALAAELAGAMIGARPLTVRHFRHRESKNEERPCLAIRFVSNDPADTQQQTTSSGMPEEVWALAVNLVMDVDLPPEPDELAPADLDPTGLAAPSTISVQALAFLFPELEANDLGGVVWDMHYDGTAEDEGDSTPDYLRLEERLTLLYRVRADQPHVLLTGE